MNVCLNPRRFAVELGLSQIPDISRPNLINGMGPSHHHEQAPTTAVFGTLTIVADAGYFILL